MAASTPAHRQPLARSAADLSVEDPIFRLLQEYRSDTRSHKIDLGIGVYRDKNNRSPVLSAVKLAEQWRVDTETDKAYIGPLGDLAFCAALAHLALGDSLAETLAPRLAYAQTPGGVGALRLAFELVVNKNPNATLWLSDTSWQVHEPIAHGAGLPIKRYAYFNVQGRVPVEQTLNQLNHASAGDAVLLQASCHNPTGLDFNAAEWGRLASICRKKQLLPIIDMAYHGLGNGLEADRYGLQYFAEQVPTLLLCYSCSKNFALYRDRVGMLLTLSQNTAQRERVNQQLMQMATRHYFTPPAHGASLVRCILQQPTLRQQWLGELNDIRLRLNDVRSTAAKLLALSPISAQRDWSFLTTGCGMFALFPLSVQEITALKRDRGIYIVENGRVNLSGLNQQNIASVISALVDVIETSDELPPQSGAGV